MSYKKSILGGLIAFIIASSCCWLPVLLIGTGGASALLGFSNGIEKFNVVFLGIGIGLLGLGLYQYRNSDRSKAYKEIITESTITCPQCGFKKEEKMPLDACQYFYACENCSKILKPIKGDCCVFCSYGTIACPPVQSDQACC